MNDLNLGLGLELVVESWSNSGNCCDSAVYYIKPPYINNSTIKLAEKYKEYCIENDCEISFKHNINKIIVDSDKILFFKSQKITTNGTVEGSNNKYQEDYTSVFDVWFKLKEEE